jgi:putative DNA primase/helicase
MNDYPNLMCLNNGILDLNTKVLHPHSSDYFFDSVINIDYEPDNNECPTFVKFLKEVFNDDKDDVENAIRLGGYLLDTSCKAEKMFIFLGDGGSGKSTLINVYSMFFDPSQLTGLSLDVLSNEISFQREKLIKSRFNQCAEAKKGYLASEEIKKIVTGDLMEVDRKFKTCATFRPRTKIIVAANGEFKFEDTSEGISRRLLFFYFKNKYRSQKELDYIPNYQKKGFKVKDPELAAKFKAEKNAIFNLFINGLDLLRKDHYDFLFSDKSVQALNEYRRDSDTIREFLEDNYEVDEDNKFIGLSVLDHYRQWYRQNVQDTSSMKLRMSEMAKRIKEVFNIQTNGRVCVKNENTNEYERPPTYPLRKVYIAPPEMDLTGTSFDVSNAVKDPTLF